MVFPQGTSYMFPDMARGLPCTVHLICVCSSVYGDRIMPCSKFNLTNVAQYPSVFLRLSAASSYVSFAIRYVRSVSAPQTYYSPKAPIRVFRCATRLLPCLNREGHPPAALVTLRLSIDCKTLAMACETYCR